MMTRPSVDHSPWASGRHSVSLTAAGVAAFVTLSALVLVSPVYGAKGPRPLPANLAMFEHCPVNDKAVTTCIFSSADQSTFQIGSTSVSATSPTTLSLGLIIEKTGSVEAVLPDDGTSALQSAPIPLPGGLTGIPGLDSGDLSVTVTPQLVGLPSVNLVNILTGQGPGFVLPLDVLISTPTGLLGSDCTIGGPSSPITLNLTTGTTNPPSPNAPITGSPGTFTFSDDVTTDTGIKLVDNAFAVPGVENCGNGGILDEVLDLDKSLPSAAGNNSAVLGGDSYIVPAKLIRHYLH
jgi:hypothetical protein